MSNIEIFMKIPATMPDLVDYILGLRASGKPSPAILAFCISDELPLKACLAACREARSIPVVMATMNQVNSDGGYSGQTSLQFVEFVRHLSQEAGYEGPIIFGRDHGGPYIVAAQKSIPRHEIMQWVKHNITQDLQAGFTCWHADGTSGQSDEQADGQLPVDLIVDTTLEMIQFCESERMRLGIGPISYEIGSEEQQGGLTSPEKLDSFLKRMTAGLALKGLNRARIDFIVVQTGTHMRLQRSTSENSYALIQNGFNPHLVKELDRIAALHRKNHAHLLFTQHYSDHIPAADMTWLLSLHIGKVNFGPEMTMPELQMLLEWEDQERRVLAGQDRLDLSSGFRKAMINALDENPHIWMGYIPRDQYKIQAGTLSAYGPDVQDAIMIFRGRYVKSRPHCRSAIKRLLANIVHLGIHPDPEAAIMEKIKTSCAIPRIHQLRINGIKDAFSNSL